MMIMIIIIYQATKSCEWIFFLHWLEYHLILRTALSGADQKWHLPLKDNKCIFLEIFSILVYTWVTFWIRHFKDTFTLHCRTVFFNICLVF